MQNAFPLLFSPPDYREFFCLKPSLIESYHVTFITFDNKKEIKFSGDLHPIHPQDFFNSTSVEKLELFHGVDLLDTKISYQNKVEDAKDFLRIQHIPKVVLSRRKFLPTTQPQLEQILVQFRKDFPKAFIYYFVNQQDKTAWIGGFSEILGAYNTKEKTFQCHSLAGTKHLQEAFTEKEFHEQQEVSDSIAAILSEFSLEYSTSDLEIITSGKLKHIKKTFFAITDEFLVPLLLERLHPTPAVCGNPVLLCKEFINKTEQLERKFYAGRISVRLPKLNIYTDFVNLRCGELYKNGILLYAGGGITQISQATSEWEETEAKSNALGQYFT